MSTQPKSKVSVGKIALLVLLWVLLGVTIWNLAFSNGEQRHVGVGEACQEMARATCTRGLRCPSATYSYDELEECLSTFVAGCCGDRERCDFVAEQTTRHLDECLEAIGDLSPCAMGHVLPEACHFSVGTLPLLP